MPIHNWKPVPAGLFHHFHQTWSVHLTDRLNAGLLPQGLSALVEQRARSKTPDILAIEMNVDEFPPADVIEAGGVAIKESPSASIVRRTENEIYGDLANQIVVRHHLGRIVAILEILSPGNKDSRSAIHDLVDKTTRLMRDGIHVMLIDLFPPTPRDPQGIHKVVWDEFEVEEFIFPAGKDRLVVSYEGGPGPVAYIEPLAVGDDLPEMPLMLTKSLHIKIPLESVYMESWNRLPQPVRTAVETGHGLT